MSLLQDPFKTLDQIEWYLDNQDLEKFPGAFIRSAGNLSRQLLEQILFILAFYSKMPLNKYMKTNHQLRTADKIWESLQTQNPLTEQIYLEDARRCNPRVKKFAQFSRSFNKWRRTFNEPSHYRNPMTLPHTKEQHIREFLYRLRSVLDPKDSHLITAAVNELVSRGKVKAIIGNDPTNTPGIIRDVIVTPQLFSIVDGKLTWHSGKFKMHVIPSDKEMPLLKWKNQIILVHHSEAISIGIRFITEDGQPVNMTDFGLILTALGKTPEARERVKRYFKRKGILIKWEKTEKTNEDST